MKHMHNDISRYVWEWLCSVISWVVFTVYCVHSSVPLFIYSLIPSFVRLFVCSFVPSFVPSFLRLFISSFVGTLIRWFVCSLVGWFVSFGWLVRLFVRWFLLPARPPFVPWLVGWLVGWFIHSIFRLFVFLPVFVIIPHLFRISVHNGTIHEAISPKIPGRQEKRLKKKSLTGYNVN